MHISLKNKRILVTGGSRGIGKAIVEELGKSGATVAIHYNQNKEIADVLVREIENDSFSVQADLNNMSNIESLFRQTVDKLGHLDVIINNAGIAVHSPIEKGAMEWISDWKKTMDVNLNATGLLCKLAIQHFQTRKEGIVINISSRAAFRGDTADYMAYAASKGGMVALTRSIARAFGKDGIKAFTVAPGFIQTDMAQDFIEEYGEAYVLDDLALNELTQPHHLTPLIILMSSGLMNHATGGTFDINAGSYVH